MLPDPVNFCPHPEHLLQSFELIGSLSSNCESNKKMLLIIKNAHNGSKMTVPFRRLRQVLADVRAGNSKK